jgi:hypothetical protein
MKHEQLNGIPSAVLWYARNVRCTVTLFLDFEVYYNTKHYQHCHASVLHFCNIEVYKEPYSSQRNEATLNTIYANSVRCISYISSVIKYYTVLLLI